MDIYFKNESTLTCLSPTKCVRGKRLSNKESEYMNYLEQVYKIIKALDKESEDYTMDAKKFNDMKIGEFRYDGKGFRYCTSTGIEVPFGNITCNYTKDDILVFEEIVPEQVVVVYFEDGQSEKMVCQEPDIFDLHRCLYLAIAKHLYKKEYTTRGIEYKAAELSMQKKYVKIVEKAIKDHNKMIEEREKLERLELERIAAKNRRLQKKQEKREQAKELKREEAIEMQKEAYLRAMKEYKSDKKKEK